MNLAAFHALPESERLAHMQTRIDRNPFSHLLKLRIVAAGEGHAAMELPLGPEVMQMLGLVHGGALATLIDSASACSLWPRLEAEGLKAVTLELKVNYLASPRGAWARAASELIRYGRSTAFVETGVHDEGGKLCCRASATFFILRNESPA